MKPEDSIQVGFTHENTTIDQLNSHFENGIVFPDGSTAWGEQARIRGYSLPDESAPTEQEQGRLQDLHALKLKGLGVTPTNDLRLHFVRRAVVVSHGQAEAVPEWL